jgi:short-subunit dehydrogenase
MTVLITGASSGIGRAVANAFAGAGAELVLWGRNEERLAAVANEVEHKGGRATWRAVDLTHAAERNAAATALPDVLHGVVHSAGTIQLGSLEELSERALHDQWLLNAHAPAMLTQALLPRLRRSHGHVLFINSGAGVHARAGWSGYAMTKHALKALADALREEERPHGVQVTSVYPGRTDTPMQHTVRQQEGGPYQADAYVAAADVAQAVLTAFQMNAPSSMTDVHVRPR